MASSGETSGSAAWWTGDRVGGLILVAIAGIVGLETTALSLGSLARPGPGFAPLVCAVILAVLGLLVALRRGGEPVINLRWGEARHAALIFGASAFAAVALERIGFRLTTLAILVFLIGVVERKPPLAVAAVAFILSFGCYYLFWNVLRVPLPTGPFGI